MPNFQNARIALKYATLAQWEASVLELKAGEVAFAQKTDGSLIMKVGPGAWANAKEITLTELGNYYTQTQIDELLAAVNKAIADEVKRAGDAEAALQQAIEAEAERALGVEAGLDAAIKAEAGRAAGAEEALNTAIGNEVTRATEAETALGGRIDGVVADIATINNEDTGILAQAKEYADGKDGAIANAQSVADQAKAAIDAFLDDKAVSDDVVNTLKEIQEGLDAGEESAASLLAEINKIKDGTTVAPKADDADKLDGHDSTYFATAVQGGKADTAVQNVTATGSNGVTASATKTGTDVAVTVTIDTAAEWVFDCGGAN